MLVVDAKTRKLEKTETFMIKGENVKLCLSWPSLAWTLISNRPFQIKDFSLKWADVFMCISMSQIYPFFMLISFVWMECSSLLNDIQDWQR